MRARLAVLAVAGLIAALAVEHAAAGLAPGNSKTT